jgi:hypothetical protein
VFSLRRSHKIGGCGQNLRAIETCWELWHIVCAKFGVQAQHLMVFGV